MPLKVVVGAKAEGGANLTYLQVNCKFLFTSDDSIAAAVVFRLTRIAIVIVGIFITCHLPRFIPNVVEMFMKNLPEVSLFHFTCPPSQESTRNKLLF